MRLHLDGQARSDRMFAIGGGIFDMIEAQKGENPVYKCEHFQIKELVPPDLFEEYKDRQHILWQQFDVRALMTLDALRERFGSATVNNWKWGGKRTLSGWRPDNCTTGAKRSQHKRGAAFDLKFKNTSAHSVRKELFQADAQGGQFGMPCFRHITCIEDFPGMSWFHFDVRNHDVGTLGLLVVDK
ncbi:MAG: hypothetical protein JEY79_14080 [Pseudodesulfovibrio sp.]|nr:hypothetical protein [Pseudodesulfovibrio sp.]